MKNLEEFVTTELWNLSIVQEKLKDLIRLQLSKGISPDGKIGVNSPGYAAFKGIPVDVVNLKLTGSYWDSFDLEVSTDWIFINTNKPFLLQDYPNHLSLTKESEAELTTFLTPIIKDYAQRYIQFTLKNIR